MNGRADYLALYEFQFTHPGGVRLFLRGVSWSLQVFQFTHPGGVRLYPK